jgi:hypothetical protein
VTGGGREVSRGVQRWGDRVPPELLLPDPDLMASPEGDTKGLRELQAEARRRPDATDQRHPGTHLIAVERHRQIHAEGYAPEHDAWHADESLALAACAYALPAGARQTYGRRVPVGDDEARAMVPALWPWHPGYWKPTPDDRVRELVKAGALIAAVIDAAIARGSSS